MTSGSDATTRPMQAQHVMVTVPKSLGVDAQIAHVRAEFEDDHVHMVLVVDRDGRLVTTIERDDLAPELDGSSLASGYGRLEGRTVHPMTSSATVSSLLNTGRRRLAVIDEDGRLHGLVCLKRNRSDYCDDQDVRARAKEMSEALPDPLWQEQVAGERPGMKRR